MEIIGAQFHRIRAETGMISSPPSKFPASHATHSPDPAEPDVVPDGRAVSSLVRLLGRAAAAAWSRNLGLGGSLQPVSRSTQPGGPDAETPAIQNT
jgi:hypothetical protein